MYMNNPFENPSFNMVALTDAINLLPNNYGRVGQLKIFKDKFVKSRHIAIEENNGVLSLLLTKTPGSPGSVGLSGKRQLRSFTVPHIPHDDVVLPEEIQGVRAFGSENNMSAISEIIADHLQSMRNKHAITLEYLRMGALKGIVMDADGSVLVDLFQAFGITPKIVNFGLSNANSDVKKKCIEVVRHIEKNLLGEFMNGVYALVSPGFFDQLTSHPQVKEAYERWEDGQALRNDMRSGFKFAGITFEEYNAEATDANGTIRKFIKDGEAHCFPIGTSETFRTYFAPGDFNDTINTIAKPIYAKSAQRQHGRGTDLHTQSNPLPLCLRPGILVKLV